MIPQASLPTPAGVDALGNPTPAGMLQQAQVPAQVPSGANVLADSAPENNGTLPLAPPGGANIFQILKSKDSPFLKSPTVRAMAQGANAAAAANPKAAAAPMGWARTILAGAMNALGGLQDAAAADTRESSGALGGIERTIAARGQRIAQQQEQMSKEKTEELQRAETVQRIAANVRNTYRQDQQTRTESYDQNAKFMNDLRPDHDVQDNISQSQLNDMLKKDPNFWKTHTGRPVSEEPVFDGAKPAVDKNGNPVMSPLYSIANLQTKDGTAGKHEVTDEESKYLKIGGNNIPAGTIMPLKDWDAAVAISDGVRATKKKIEAANNEEMSDEQARQLSTEMNDPRIQHYMSMVPGEPLGGLYQAQKNVQDHISAIDQNIAAIQQKVKTPAGGVNPTVQALQTQRQQYVDEQNKVNHVITAGFNDKAKNDYQKDLLEQQKEAETERHNRADEAAKKLEDNTNAPIANVPLTPEIQQTIDTLPPAQKALLSQYDNNTQSALMSVAFGNGEQDLEKNFPVRLYKGQAGLNTNQALGVIHQLNPNWSEQSYAVKQAAYKSATSGKLSEQADSLNNFVGHAAEARRVADSVWNSDVKLFNKPINALASAGFGTQATSLQEAISVVNGEFGTMIKSGYAPTKEEVEAQSALVDKNSTLGQINAALKVMANMATTRATTMDHNYMRATGNHFPDLINSDNQDDARYLGIPVERFYTGGRIGGSGNAPQMQNTQTGTRGQATPNAPPAPKTVPVGARPITNKKTGQLVGYQDQNGNVVRF